MSDLIRREDAIKRATEEHDFYRGASLPTDKARRDELLNVMCWLNELPSAEPERKTGHWVYDKNGMDWNLPAWVCSECHGRNSMIPTYIRGKDKMIKVEHPLRWAGSKYCPNCGAKMEEES